MDFAVACSWFLLAVALLACFGGGAREKREGDYSTPHDMMVISAQGAPVRSIEELLTQRDSLY